ncbi:NRDE family protein [Pelomicrobium sp. G1]|uniref:NRDE family protein n=1 Tax=unclassified Pelomicrobium TaxID=2815318 RepID=UPI000ACB387A
MCLALLALHTHPRYRLIVAANRDEFYDRSTAPAAFWPDHPQVLAGRDLAEGGTWLGITRTGRFALVTNYREGGARREGAPSRGRLVSDFLTGAEAPEAYARQVASRAGEYNGYNLIVGDGAAVVYQSNRAEGIRRLTEGVYGLSNHLLDTPWPKVRRSKETLFGLLEQEGPALLEGLFRMLADHSRPGDGELPETGIGLEWERLLSAAFIASDTYGTRSSSVVLVGRDGTVQFVERSFGPRGATGSQVAYEFTL